MATNVAGASDGAAVEVHGAGRRRDCAGAPQRFRQGRAGNVDEALREMVLVVRRTAWRVVAHRAVVVPVRYPVLIVVTRVQRERSDERLRSSGPGGNGQALRLPAGLSEISGVAVPAVSSSTRMSRSPSWRRSATVIPVARAGPDNGSGVSALD